MLFWIELEVAGIDWTGDSHVPSPLYVGQACILSGFHLILWTTETQLVTWIKTWVMQVVHVYGWNVFI
jgi:hypothetical protein